MPEALWKRVPMRAVVSRTREEEAPARRWVLQGGAVAGRKVLVLVSPRGRRMQFRLNRGAWVRRMKGNDDESEDT